MNIKTEIKEYGFPVTHNCVQSETRIAELETQLAAASCDLADVKAHLAQVSSEKIRLEADLVIERERNLNNVANAQLQIDELTSEYQTWRMACGKARERADAAVAEMQAMVSRLTALADEFQTEETWDGKRNDALRYCARRLREAIMRSQGSKSRAKRGGEDER